MAKCKTGLYRVRQLLAARETDCGIPAYIDPTAKAVEVQVSPTFNESLNMIENNVARKTLTRTPNIAGMSMADLNFTAFAKGSGDASIEPAFGIFLEGSSFAPSALEKFTLDTITLEFEVGEIVTGGTSSATGIVRVLSRNNNGVYYIEPVTGTFVTSETITGATSGATANTAILSTEGFEYKLTSEQFQNLTIRSEEDGVITKEGNGMLGSFSLTGDSSNPASFDFTFNGRIGRYYRVAVDVLAGGASIATGETLTWAGGEGVVVADYVDADPYLIYNLVSGVAIPTATAITASGGASCNSVERSYRTIDTTPFTTGVSFDPTVPPIVQCAEFSVNGFQPILQQFVLDIQNEVVVREDLNSCTGNQPATITGRNPQLSFNPEVFDVNDWDVYDSYKRGEIVTGFDLWIGNVSGNTIFIQMDGVQVQTIADGDRDGTAIFDITSNVISSTDDGELSIYFL